MAREKRKEIRARNSSDEKYNRRTRLKIHRSIETTTLSDPVGVPLGRYLRLTGCLVLFLPPYHIIHKEKLNGGGFVAFPG